ncbi:uncharacterized protein F5Z01DRAFT_143389 [Emericellopsis atlantica]|uniref:Uncharacterized protein n=1 Tax=Emericellopsis atlantica TaxID=2614577 RepID=A0A9P8CN92_9HYPO|nr:uncharacterized protein F5Z01DRAFT_143389 [Emericellopsis atlantica]KAG9253529.1 hypothetical protein F5Z01DRAFT_143389 [Emericellopsis atlantica]
MASAPPSSRTAGGMPASNASRPSALYKLVMTPVNFITFVLSLVIIDIQYSLKRSHNHAQAHSRLPAWLHALLYRPYEDGTSPNAGTGVPWYYHTKQKKLLRMETEDAFKIRSTMLVFLAVLVTSAVAGSWWLIRSIVQLWLPALSV